jgi:NADP-dependent 3-hydroxy acid dehydrogenase YdfG
MSYVNGKIAVVTGAGSGIGRALALALNRQGCRLYLGDINAGSLAETVGLLLRKEVSADSEVLDVADREAIHAWAERINAAHGYVDIVINNAGVAVVSTAEEDTYENLEWLMGINFWGVVHGTRAFLPLLRRAEQGHLVNLSSIFGLIAVPTQSAYHAAKFAVRGYTEALRQEMEDTNVHVCCVHPGGIKTNIARAARSNDTIMSAQQRDDAFRRIAKTTPEAAARQIISAIERRKPRLLIGRDAVIVALLSRLFPVSYPRFLALFADSGDLLKTS